MNNKKLILALVALVAVVALFLGVYFITQGNSASAQPEAEGALLSFTVTVVHSDGSEKDFTYEAESQKLGAFLEAEGLIASEGADAGMFHTVDGEKADWSVNQSYWAFYLGEEYATKGIYDTDITDGAVYKLVYTLG